MNAELETQLQNALTQEPRNAVETAITVYLMAKAQADAANAIADAAKKLIADVMTETGETAYTTQAGKVAISSPSVNVSYDAKAIDILMADDPDLAMRLSPYRKESQRAGTMRITAAK